MEKKNVNTGELSFDHKTKLLDHLLQFVTSNKRMKFGEVLSNRTSYITVVLEDIYQSHNASAVLRSCDCFGIQNVHIIENRNTYTVNPDVALGASKWLTIHKYNRFPDNTEDCLNRLKADGYTIVATTPHNNDYTLEELPLDNKVALLFGTELEGLSQKAMKMSDRFMRIPIYGFTESFNISVTVAICLYYLSRKIRSENLTWKLNEEEMLDTSLLWVRSVVKKAHLIERKFLDSL